MAYVTRKDTQPRSAETIEELIARFSPQQPQQQQAPVSLAALLEAGKRQSTQQNAGLPASILQGINIPTGGMNGLGGLSTTSLASLAGHNPRKSSNPGNEELLKSLLGVGDRSNLHGRNPDALPSFSMPEPPSASGSTGIIGPVAPQADPNATAMQELWNLIGGSAGGIGEDQLSSILNEATKAAGAGFGGQIGSIRRQNKRAKADTAEGSEAINRMYRQLDKSYKRDAKREASQSKDMAAAVQETGAQGAEALEKSIASTLDRNAVAGDILGSEGLTQQLNTSLEGKTADNQGRLVENAQEGSNLILSHGNTNRAAMNERGINVRHEGTEKSADLYSDLQDYLQGNRDKISELRGQRAAAVAQARASAASQVGQANASAQQDQIANIFKFLTLSNDMTQQQFMNGITQQKLALDGQGSNNPFEGLLPDEMANTAALQRLMSPQGLEAYNILSDNASLGTGQWTPNGTSQNLPLNNLRNLTQYIQENLQDEGGPGYGTLSPGDQTALIGALLNQLKGTPSYNRQ